MDYGQPVNTPNQEPFFTAGVGNDKETLNPDKDNSLTVGTYAPERDPKNIGNAAISSSEQASLMSETSMNQAPGETSDDQALGQFVNLEMPPNTVNPDMTTQTGDSTSVEVTDKPKETGIKAAKIAGDKLNQDGNAADFYNKIQDLREQEK